MSENISTQEENDAIQTDIAKTRQRMDDTLDRLVDRFRPRHLLNDLLDLWQSRRDGNGDPDLSDALEAKARTAGRALAHQIRDNPMPSLLLGAGLAWLIFDHTRPEHEPRRYEPDMDEDPGETYGEEASFPGSYPLSGSSFRETTAQTPGAGEMAERFGSEARRRVRQGGRHLRECAKDLRERATESSHRMREHVGERGQKMRERAAEWSHDVRDRVREGYEHTQDRMMQSCQRAQQNLQTTADNHPLATGAACLGIGLLVGFLLPKSDREDDWFGETSTAVKDRVKNAGQDLVARGQRVAETGVQAAQSEAERQGLTPARLKESVKNVGEQTREAVQQSAEEEGLVPESTTQTTQAASGNKQTSNSGHEPQSPAV